MFKKFLGDYEFIWGPVKKGICESSYYHFLTSSEELHELDITLGYKTRNAIKIAKEKNNLYEQILVIERIAGMHAFSASLSYCLAVEDYFYLTDKIPEYIKLIRMFFAELERLRNHVENLSEISGSTYLEVPSSLYAYYAEKIKQISSEVNFSRYLMGINTVGGIRLNNLNYCIDNAGASASANININTNTNINITADIDANIDSNANTNKHNKDILKGFEYIIKEISLYIDNIEKIIKQNSETKSHIDRLKTTGKINLKIAEKFHAEGIVAKSVGINKDLRLKYPYLSYKDIKLKPVSYNDGDALSRYLVRIAEIRQSFNIIKICFEKLAKNFPDNIFHSIESSYSSLSSSSDLNLKKQNKNEIEIDDNAKQFFNENLKNKNNFYGVNAAAHSNKYGFGFTESSEGPIFCIAGEFNGKVFKKLNIKYPFDNNYKVFSYFTKNTMMMDFNINETSYNFSVAACDK
ncbi:MAG: NADH-quinone oxidoreductase subunit D-related protein [bacterium]